jgi:hypothetical protein
VIVNCFSKSFWEKLTLKYSAIHYLGKLKALENCLNRHVCIAPHALDFNENIRLYSSFSKLCSSASPSVLLMYVTSLPVSDYIHSNCWISSV